MSTDARLSKGSRELSVSEHRLHDSKRLYGLRNGVSFRAKKAFRNFPPIVGYEKRLPA